MYNRRFTDYYGMQNGGYYEQPGGSGGAGLLVILAVAIAIWMGTSGGVNSGASNGETTSFTEQEKSMSLSEINQRIEEMSKRPMEPADSGKMIFVSQEDQYNYEKLIKARNEKENSN